MTKNNPTVLIADGEDRVRFILRLIIRILGFTYVGEARDGAEALELYRQRKPDLLLLDASLPAESGSETLKLLKAEFPDSRVMMLTSGTDKHAAAEFIAHRGVSCIHKNSPAQRLQEAIQKAADGLAAWI